MTQPPQQLPTQVFAQQRAADAARSSSLPVPAIITAMVIFLGASNGECSGGAIPPPGLQAYSSDPEQVSAAAHTVRYAVVNGAGAG